MNDARDTGYLDQKSTFESLDIIKIMELIPHRYPFLMIDRVIDIVPDESAVGIKNVSINEPQFQGHFAAQPVMPGVLIIESMAQTSAVLMVATLGEEAWGQVIYFVTVDKTRFRKPVTPGDVMKLYVRKDHQRGRFWRFHCVTKVDDVIVAEGIATAMLQNG